MLPVYYIKRTHGKEVQYAGVGTPPRWHDLSHGMHRIPALFDSKEQAEQFIARMAIRPYRYYIETCDVKILLIKEGRYEDATSKAQEHCYFPPL